MALSYSQLQLYQTCPRQYEFAHVKKIPRSISAGESFGSSVHNTLAKWGKLEGRNQEIRKSGNQDQFVLFAEEPEANCQLLTANLLTELWHQSFIIEGYQSKADADAARGKGEKIMQLFFNWWQQEGREVMVIEKGFTINLSSESSDSSASSASSFSGRFDRIERTPDGLHIIDFKTGAVRSQEEVDSDLQLSIYALAAEQMFGEPCAALSLLFLHEEGITDVQTKRSVAQLEEAVQVITSLQGGIAHQQFVATPSETACGRCPYKTICPSALVTEHQPSATDPQ